MPPRRITKKKKERVWASQHRTIIEFIDDIGKIDPDDIMVPFVKRYFEEKKVEEIGEYVRLHVEPRQSEIRNRDLDFFERNKNSLFEGLPQNYIDHYAQKVRNLEKDDLIVVWSYFDKLLDLQGIIKEKVE